MGMLLSVNNIGGVMTAYYYAAPEVERMAATLIAKHHRHLQGIRMEFLFRSEASRSGGKLRLGQARKITGLNALLATPDIAHDPEASSEGCEFFTIEIAADTWELMGEKAKIGIVDHELSHCVVDIDADGNAILSMRKHDLEEFAAVLRRNGLYRPDVTAFIQAVGPEEVSIWQDLPLELESGDEETEPEIPFDQLPDSRQPPPGVSADGEILKAASEGQEGALS